MIGALVGGLVNNPVNGTVLAAIVWILDVILGPVLDAQDRPVASPGAHALCHPVDPGPVLPSAGRLGDLGRALLGCHLPHRAGAQLACLRATGRTRRVWTVVPQPSMAAGRMR
ncbi:hypothetical protein [Streptomyces sp. NPDC001530]|uniref:hypothetical protein n=1 Tax=Streptomyces sp. NPDC001530 TaxID=3364582 RepID=UPI0036B3A8C6